MQIIKVLILFFTIIGSSTLSARAELPKNYKSLSGCQKQNILWRKIENSEYLTYPKLKNLGGFQLLKMAFQKMSEKTNKFSDLAPIGWKKYLHARGVMAKVKIIIPDEFEKSPYTGIFQGAECALIRLSVTYNPKKESKAFAPGLALKILRDETHSANISALYTLGGQGRNFNFFENALSNIVPTGDELGMKLVNKIFKRVSKYPEQLNTYDMAQFNNQGSRESQVISPRQIFFVPNPQLAFSTQMHDFRRDLVTISKGTTLYDIYALDRSEQDFTYDEYTLDMIPKFLKKSKPIARIVTDSKFILSSFGDDRILFRHEVVDNQSSKKK